jgi:hypothetical protein
VWETTAKNAATRLKNDRAQRFVRTAHEHWFPNKPVSSRLFAKCAKHQEKYALAGKVAYPSSSEAKQQGAKCSIETRAQASPSDNHELGLLINKSGSKKKFKFMFVRSALVSKGVSSVNREIAGRRRVRLELLNGASARADAPPRRATRRRRVAANGTFHSQPPCEMAGRCHGDGRTVYG